jgi:hypothetical protein
VINYDYIIAQMFYSTRGLRRFKISNVESSANGFYDEYRELPPTQVSRWWKKTDMGGGLLSFTTSAN